MNPPAFAELASVLEVQTDELHHNSSPEDRSASIPILQNY